MQMHESADAFKDNNSCYKFGELLLSKKQVCKSDVMKVLCADDMNDSHPNDDSHDFNDLHDLHYPHDSHDYDSDDFKEVDKQVVDFEENEEQLHAKFAASAKVVEVDTSRWPEYVVRATRWLQLWFDGCPAQQICQLHGIKVLDELLSAVHWLGVDDCIQEIIKASVLQAQICRRVARPWVYKQLVSQSEYELPPIGQSWTNVPELCWICHVMPTIFERSLHALWIKYMLGDINQLYMLSTHNYLSVTPNLDDVCCFFTDFVVVGSDWYSAVTCQEYCYLVKLTIEQQGLVHDDLSPEQLANYQVVAKMEGKPFSLVPSPCNEYLLWRVKLDGDKLLGENVEDTDSKRNMVICVKTKACVEMLDCFAKKRNMWWVETNKLVTAATGNIMQVLNLDVLNKEHRVKSYFGQYCEQTHAVTCASWMNHHSTILTVEWRKLKRSVSLLINDTFELFCVDKRDATGCTFLVWNTSTRRYSIMHLRYDEAEIAVCNMVETTEAEGAHAGSRLVWQRKPQKQPK